MRLITGGGGRFAPNESVSISVIRLEEFLRGVSSRMIRVFVDGRVEVLR